MIVVRGLEPEDFSDGVVLAASVFGIAPEFLSDWVMKRVVENPWQHYLAGCGAGAWDGDVLVGCRFMFAQPWWLEGKETVVAFGAHTCILEKYRGQGLANELTKRSTECANICASTTAGVSTQPIFARNGYELIANDNDFFRIRVSWRGSMQKRLGFALGGSVGYLADQILRAGGKGFSRVKGYTFHIVQRCDDKFDLLWRRVREGYRSCLVRSSDYLNWRLFDHQTCPLRLGGLYDSQGYLKGYVVWHVQDFDHHVRMAVLRDLFFEANDVEVAESLLGFLVSHWCKESVTWASLEVAHPFITTLFRNKGFEHTPSHGSRYYVHIPRGIDNATRIDWFRSGLDGDYADLRSPYIS